MFYHLLSSMSCFCYCCYSCIAEQGTKRKRDGPSDDDDESGEPEEGGEDAAPLC